MKERDWSVYRVHIRGGVEEYVKVRADGIISVGRRVSFLRYGEYVWRVNVLLVFLHDS